MKGRIILLGVGIMFAAGVWAWNRHRMSALPEMVLHGNVEIRGADWGFRVGGRVAELLKQEGDPVKPGECLAKLDEEPFRHELEMKKAEEAAAKAEWKKRTAGFRVEEISQAEAQVEQAKVAHDNAKSAWKRQESLIAGGSTSKQLLEDSAAAEASAAQAMRVAEAKLHLLRAGFRSEEIEAAKQQFNLASAARAAAELRLRDASLHAASEGTVLTRAVEPGAIVQPGATVFGISLNDPVWIRAYAAEPFLPQLTPGTEVTIRADGANRTYHGRVGFVSPKAEFTPKSVETPELRTMLVYRFRVVVADPDSQLRQGMPVTISKETSQ